MMASIIWLLDYAWCIMFIWLKIKLFAKFQNDLRIRTHHTNIFALLFGLLPHTYRICPYFVRSLPQECPELPQPPARPEVSSPACGAPGASPLLLWPGQNAAAAAGLAPAVCLSKRRQKPRPRERMGVNASSYPHSCSPRFGGNSQTQHTFIGKWLTTALFDLGAAGYYTAHLQLKVIRKWAWLIWPIY